MRILGLAKELGIPYERLLAWCHDAGLDYRRPEDVVEPEHAAMARSMFLTPSGREDGASASGPEEDLWEAWVEDEDLDASGFPRTLEELDAIERELFKGKPAARAERSREQRIPLESLLGAYGIEDKAVIKKIRRLLPEHISRLFNHENLPEAQAARLREAIEDRIALCCGHASCRELLEKRHGEKNVVLTREASACRLCSGSASKRALQEMALVCAEAGIRRILVVGGAPSSHNELKNNPPPGLEFRLVEGDVSRGKQRASADLKWCDVALIWAGTILGHEVSQNYMRGKSPGGAPVLVVHRRSVEALARAVVHHVKGKDR
jgi:hypothetical protein